MRSVIGRGKFSNKSPENHTSHFSLHTSVCKKVNKTNKIFYILIVKSQILMYN